MQFRTRPRVLLIEDEKDIAELIRYNLERDGFQVLTASTGEEGWSAARSQAPSLILLDLILPGIQGLEVCRRLRQDPATRPIPLIVLTAKGEESDVVLGLELGADDYITKPFGVKELVARIRAVLRRSEEAAEVREETVLEHEGVVVDSARHQVFLQGRPVEFTLAEFRILRALLRSPGKVCTRDRLLDEITEGKSVILDRNVDVHIRSIRKKLGAKRDLIVTVRGVGYKCQSSG